ncbi:MAG: hypothetical protein ACTHJ7_08300, partial [Candidatus Nitrosocosmicus sp.]
SVTTVESEYSTLINSLVSSGYVIGSTLYIDLLTPSGTAGRGTSIPTLNSWIKTTYPNSYVDFYTPFADASGNFTQSIDNVHPDPDASQGMYNQWVTYFNLPTRFSNRGNFHAVTYNPNGAVSIANGVYKSMTPDHMLNIISSNDPTGASSFTSQIHVGSSSGSNGAGGLYFSTNGSNQGQFGAGYDAGVARSTSWALINMNAGELDFFNQTGATVGSNATPVKRGQISASGLWAIGSQTPTALLHIAAGSASSNSAPLKFTTGSLMTTPEAGAVEYDGTNIYATNSTAVRYTIAKTLTTTATLDFPSTSAQSSSELTVTVTGAADGDIVEVGVPNASANTNSCFTARVSSANTISVTFNNYSSAAIDPASGTFRVSIIKY